MIKRDQLKSTPPPIINNNGYVNVVLAVWKKENYCETNTYIPRWHIVNTVYYNKNIDEYEGWIELEDLKLDS